MEQQRGRGKNIIFNSPTAAKRKRSVWKNLIFILFLLSFLVEMAGDIYYQLLSENKQYRITIDSQYIPVSELKRRISIELGKITT